MLPPCECVPRKLLMVGEVLLECLGGDLGVALAELVHQQLVRLASPVVFVRVGVLV